jgi:hypothetical protein
MTDNIIECEPIGLTGGLRVPTSGTVHGAGKIGRKLWVRNPNNQWVLPPYGAGVDNFLRSINVRDKKKRWQTPSWPEVSYSYSALNVKVPPGRIWDNRSGENPVADVGLHHPGYVKMFYTAPRTNETWRIVNLLNSIPATNPNQGIPRFYKTFGPRGAFIQYGHTDYYYGVPSTDGGAYAAVYDTGDSNYQLEYEGLPVLNVGPDAQLCDYGNIRQAEPSRGRTFFPSLSLQEGGTSGMLDLASIRSHLQFEFPQNNFYVGQYADISEMITKRVFIFGRVVWNVDHYAEDNTFIYGLPEVEEAFATARFQFYYNTNATGLAIEVWPYLPRFPVSRTINGTRFINQVGLGGPTKYTSGGTVSARASRVGGRYVQLNILEPGEDNITFTCIGSNDAATNSTTAQHYVGDGPNRVQVAAPYPFGIYTSCAFQPTGIEIHYAIPGYDTPESTHQPDLGIG